MYFTQSPPKRNKAPALTQLFKSYSDGSLRLVSFLIAKALDSIRLRLAALSLKGKKMASANKKQTEKLFSEMVLEQAEEEYKTLVSKRK